VTSMAATQSGKDSGMSDRKGNPTFLCLTCGRRLRPQTAVPRPLGYGGDADARYKEQVERCRQKRAEEDAAGKVGYCGEADFCNVQCAAFFARATCEFLKETSTKGEHCERFARGLSNSIRAIVDLYTWVKERRSKSR
jgi:hypothetical protein